MTRVDLVEDAVAAVFAAAPAADRCGGARAAGPPAPRLWTVDPIDGTEQFADGVPLWSTLVGLQVDGEPVLGLVDSPAVGRPLGPASAACDRSSSRSTRPIGA